MIGGMCFYPKQSAAVARDVSGKERMVGDAGGRPSGQSSLLGYPSANFSTRNEGHGESGEDNYSATGTSLLKTLPSLTSACASPLSAPPYGRRRGSAQAEVSEDSTQFGLD